MKWFRPIKHKILAIVVVYLALMSVVTALDALQNDHSKALTTPVASAPVEKPEVSLTRKDLLKYTNEYRKSKGLAPLTIDTRLNKSGQDKCKDMAEKDYWSHETSEIDNWYFFRKHISSWHAAGENLHYGSIQSEDVVDGWIISPEHEKALTDKRYELVGFGICKASEYQGEKDQYIVVQHFLSSIPD